MFFKLLIGPLQILNIPIVFYIHFSNKFHFLFLFNSRLKLSQFRKEGAVPLKTFRAVATPVPTAYPKTNISRGQTLPPGCDGTKS